MGIEKRQEESDRCSCALVDERSESGPQGRNGAGAADNFGLPIHYDLITRRGGGITCDIGYAAAYLAVIHAGRQIRVLLKGRDGKQVADSAAATATAVVPDSFISYEADKNRLLLSCFDCNIRG